MPTIHSVDKIEQWLLSLIARDTGRPILDLMEEERRFPSDPPWDSVTFVHYLREIEEHFELDFDIEDSIEVERQSRTLHSLALYIQRMLLQRASAIA